MNLDDTHLYCLRSNIAREQALEAPHWLKTDAFAATRRRYWEGQRQWAMDDYADSLDEETGR